MCLKGKTLSKNTAISITIGGLLAIVGLGFWAGKEWATYKNDKSSTAEAILNATRSIEDLAKEVKALREQNASDWTYPMMRDFAGELKSRNPGIVIPSVSEIREKYSPHGVVPFRKQSG